MAATVQDLSGCEDGEQFFIGQMMGTEAETGFPSYSDLL